MTNLHYYNIQYTIYNIQYLYNNQHNTMGNYLEDPTNIYIFNWNFLYSHYHPTEYLCNYC
jgi:hypothetical protein